MPLTIVLNVGKDLRLLEARSLILRAAGYVVKTAVCVREAVEQFQAGDFDIVILCHSLTAEDSAYLARCTNEPDKHYLPQSMNDTG